ncbi:MAG: hypothetical protein KKA07_00360 [Bacteroidetes bacterium]|nr:hypothetical protein [Bacteroidota bacterium]MBU1717503.1 hypothetical protein [Bacteroidota bacterium]
MKTILISALFVFVAFSLNSQNLVNTNIQQANPPAQVQPANANVNWMASNQSVNTTNNRNSVTNQQQQTRNNSTATGNQSGGTAPQPQNRGTNPLNNVQTNKVVPQVPVPVNTDQVEQTQQIDLIDLDVSQVGTGNGNLMNVNEDINYNPQVQIQQAVVPTNAPVVQQRSSAPPNTGVWRFQPSYSGGIKMKASRSDKWVVKAKRNISKSWKRTFGHHHKSQKKNRFRKCVGF